MHDRVDVTVILGCTWQAVHTIPSDLWAPRQSQGRRFCNRYRLIDMNPKNFGKKSRTFQELRRCGNPAKFTHKNQKVTNGQHSQHRELPSSEWSSQSYSSSHRHAMLIHWPSLHSNSKEVHALAATTHKSLPPVYIGSTISAYGI